MTLRLLMLIVLALCGVLFVRVEASELKAKSPLEVVLQIMKECKPASGVYLPLKDDQIEMLSPLLSDRMTKASLAFEQMIPNHPGPGPWFNQLLWRRWQPTSQSVDSVSEKPEYATVGIKEFLKPGKIYAGYKGRTTFLLVRVRDKWVVDDVVINRHYFYTGRRLPSSDEKGSVIDLMNLHLN